MHMLAKLTRRTVRGTSHPKGLSWKYALQLHCFHMAADLHGQHWRKLA